MQVRMAYQQLMFTLVSVLGGDPRSIVQPLQEVFEFEKNIAQVGHFLASFGTRKLVIKYRTFLLIDWRLSGRTVRDERHQATRQVKQVKLDSQTGIEFCLAVKPKMN